jgi:cytochrome bd-type quinol oxidase subunit 1
MAQETRRSAWWYLLPILLGIIGGVIAYFIIKQDDPIKAKNCLKLGLVLLIINIILGVSVF